MTQSVIQENIFKIGTNMLQERKSKQHLVDRKLVQNRWKFESKLKISVQMCQKKTFYFLLMKLCL